MSGVFSDMIRSKINIHTGFPIFALVGDIGCRSRIFYYPLAVQLDEASLLNLRGEGFSVHARRPIIKWANGA